MKRLDIEDQGDGFPILVEQADGRYVKYSDVEGLIAENKILREALERIRNITTCVAVRKTAKQALEQSDGHS